MESSETIQMQESNKIEVEDETQNPDERCIFQISNASQHVSKAHRVLLSIRMFDPEPNYTSRSEFSIHFRT